MHAVSEETVEVGLTADNSGFVKAFSAAQTSVKGLIDIGRMAESAIGGIERRVESFAKKMALLGAATTATAGASLASWSSFERDMRNVSTVADEAQLSINAASDAIRGMAIGGIPKDVNDLAQGLYEVNSSGFQGAQGLDVLDKSARFAVAGLTDTQTAVKGVTSLLNAYGMAAGEAGYVTDVLFKAVEVGAMNAQEFISQIGDWSAVSSQLGVSIAEAAAAQAALTRGGMRATLGATAFSGVLRMLIRPTEEMADAYKRLGIESGKSAIEQNGLADTLNRLWEASGKNETTFAKMFNDVEGFRGALTLVTTQADLFNATAVEMGDRAQTLGTVNEAMGKQTQGVGMQFQMFKNELREMSLTMGELVAGPATTFLSWTNKLIGFVNDLPAPLKQAVAALQLLTPVLVAAGVAMGGFWIKSKLIGLALGAMSKGFMGVRVQAFVASIMAAGGPLTALRKAMTDFVTGSAAFRGAMLRSFGAGAVSLGAMAAIPIMLNEWSQAMDNAKASAKELTDEMDTLGSGTIKTTDDFNKLFADIDSKLAATAKYGSIGVIDSAIGSFENMTPFTDNNIASGVAENKALEALKAKYLGVASVIREVAYDTDLSHQIILDGLNKLQADGTIDLDLLMEQYKQFQALERMQQDAMLYSDSAFGDSGAGWKNYAAHSGMSPEDVAEYERLRGVFESLSPAVQGATTELTHLADVQARTGSASGDLANDIEKIGDAASSAGDRVDAFSGILQGLLGDTMSMRDMQSDFLQNMQQLARVMIDGGANFDIATEGGQNLQDALSAASDTVRQLAEETYRQTDSAAEATNVVAEFAAGLVATAQNAGWSTEQIAMLIGTMGLTPEAIQTLIQLPGIDPAISQLMITQAYLSGLDGYVAQAGVNIAITTSTNATGPQRPGDTVTATGAGARGKPVGGLPTDWVSDAVKGIIGNIPAKAKSGGGGGGGGGGGAKKWKMPPALRKAVEATLSRNIEVALDGIGSQAAIMDEAKRVKTWYAVSFLNEATNRTSASIFAAADKEGRDPSDDIMSLADAYNTAVKILGEAQAKLSLEMYDSLDAYKAFVDALEEAQAEASELLRWKYDNSQAVGGDEYLRHLRSMLVGAQENTQEWRDLMDEIRRVEQEDMNRRRSLWRRQYEMREIDALTYRTYLENMLSTYAMYSDDWYAIWQEIQEIQGSDTLGDWATSVQDAMQQAFDAAVNPIKQATNLVAAFGDQMDVTKDQIMGFYDHMTTGTQQWIDVIKQLQASGLDKGILQDLISAGPSSLGFAQSLAGLSPDELAKVNAQQGQIDDLTNQFGSNIATGSVGAAIANQNNYNLNIGDITLSFDPAGTTLTLGDVQTAINTAFQNFAAQLQTT